MVNLNIRVFVTKDCVFKSIHLQNYGTHLSYMYNYVSPYRQSDSPLIIFYSEERSEWERDIDDELWLSIIEGTLRNMIESGHSLYAN